LKIEKGINPNCSEATMRIRTDNLSKEEVAEIILCLERLTHTDNWYDTNYYEDTIFNIPVITITGDVPYNGAKWLEDHLSALSCGKKLKWEYESE